MLHSKNKNLIICLVAAAMMVAGLKPPVSGSATGVVTITSPDDGFVIFENPVYLSGTVSDPMIDTVYINRVGAPVIVLGRVRNDLPGVPYPVVNGQFRGWAAFNRVGRNTIRVIAIDRNGQQSFDEVEIILNEAALPSVEVADTDVENVRMRPGETCRFDVTLINNTSATQPCLLEIVLKPVPDGPTHVLSRESITLSPRARPRMTKSFALAEVAADIGFYQVDMIVRQPTGEEISRDLFQFEVYSPEAYPFQDVTETAGVGLINELGGLGAGASWADYDNDGWIDLVVPGRNRVTLFRNNGNGTFTDVSRQAGITRVGVYNRAAIWADYDNDGFKDLYITTRRGDLNFLYRNNGNGTFTNVTAQAGVAGDRTDDSTVAAWGDYNNDGFLDLYVGNNDGPTPVPPQFVGAEGWPNRLYRNNGNGTFTDVTAQTGVGNRGRTLDALWCDYDDDGDVDLFVVNDFGQFTGYPDTVYRNDGPDGRGGWRFTDVGEEIGFGSQSQQYGMGITAGDYDMDGDLDYYITGGGINLLHRNNGDGTFTEVAEAVGVGIPFPTVGPSLIYGTDEQNHGWGCTWWDYDLDGWLDLYVSNSWLGTRGNFPAAYYNPNMLYRNNRDGTFTEIAPSLGLSHGGRNRGHAFADYDNDGDLDLYLAMLGQRNVLLRNDLPTGNNWLKIELVGTVSNRDAVGAKIIVTSPGLREIRPVPNADPHLSQNSPEQLFGLGQNTTVDIEVRWPRGAVQRLTNVRANQKLVITEPRT